MTTDNIESLFNEQLKLFGPWEDKPHFAIAVSGGVDSMVLVFLAKKWALENDAKITALTVNHNLRAESHEEALFVNNILNNNQIEHYILHWYHDTIPISNIQKKARIARYKLLTDWCNSRNILHLFTGHNQNDQAETFIMRSERGCSVSGLSCISKISINNKIRVLRPLLHLNRQIINDWAVLHDINWIEDLSNSNKKFSRVVAREELNSDKLKIAKLSASAKNIARARTALDQYINNLIVKYVRIFPYGYIILNYQIFDHSEEEILTILSRAIKIIGNSDNLRFNALYKLFENLKNKNFTKTSLGQTIIEYDTCTNMIIIKIEVRKNYKIQLNKLIIFHRIYKVKSNNFKLSVGFIESKDIKKVKKYIHDKKIFKILHIMPCIYQDDQLIAVPFIKYGDDNTLNEVECSFSPKKSITQNIFMY